MVSADTGAGGGRSKWSIPSWSCILRPEAASWPDKAHPAENATDPARKALTPFWVTFCTCSGIFLRALFSPTLKKKVRFSIHNVILTFR